jgi:hypothetical protein
MALSDLLQGCSNKSDTVMIINKNVTRLTTQGCTNIVISWLYRTCWNNLVTSLVISTKLWQIVNSLFQTCWQLGTNSAGTTCWQTCYNMWDLCVCSCQYDPNFLSVGTHSTWLYDICRGREYEPVRSRQLCKSCGCGKNFPGKSKLISKEKVRYWILQLASELSDRLKIEEEKVW